MVEWKEPGADPKTAEIELYDYERDPDETKTLAVNFPERVAELRAILAACPEALPTSGGRSGKSKGSEGP